jgi:ferredoxin
MITRVWIDESEEECVCCGACECTCEAIFRLSDSEDKAKIVGDDFANYETEIIDAADCCPAGVIRYEKDGKPGPKQETPAESHELCQTCKDEMERRREEENPHSETKTEAKQTKTKPVWCYEEFTLQRRRGEILTFKDALSLLYLTIDHEQILMRVTKVHFPFHISTTELVDVLDVRAVYSKPKKALNLYTPGDIMIDRQYIRYKMYFTDLSGKLVKSGMRKILLKDLTVGKF